MATSNSSPDGGASRGQGSHDKPVSTLPSEAARITPASQQSGQDQQSASAPLRKDPINEEPEMFLEPDLPSDGRDEEGEAMIRDLPQRPELSEPPSKPYPTASKP